MLREPVARLVSSFNMRWQIEVCGRLTWTRRDCYLGVTSREVVREHAVGPFQRAAALKVWSKCSSGAGLDAACLRADFEAKLRNRTSREVSELDACRRRTPGEPLANCLGLGILGQRKLYKKMEDAAYIYRSLYYEHLRKWLRYFPAEQLLVMASEGVFEPHTIEAAMRRLSRFLKLSDETAVRSVLFSASPASTSAAPHENGRVYVTEAPDDVVAQLKRWFCPHNSRLAELLLEHRLISRQEMFPWMGTRCDEGGG